MNPKKNPKLAAALLAGLAWTSTASAVDMLQPEIDAMRMTAAGTIFFSVRDMSPMHPPCADSQWNYAVPASAPQELRDAVLDAAVRREIIDDISGTGECQGSTEILKSITTMSYM